MQISARDLKDSILETFSGKFFKASTISQRMLTSSSDWIANKDSPSQLHKENTRYTRIFFFFCLISFSVYIELE